MPKLSLVTFALALAVVGATAIAEEPDSQKSTVAKKITLASIKIEGPFPETEKQVGLFGELEQSLAKTIARLEKAAEDDDIDGVILRLRGPAVGRGKIHELRSAIFRARERGTKVYADLQMALPADYLIASACDQIVMPPGGALVLTGVRAEVMFFKDLLQKIGVQADFIQVGDFKGAAEPYMRSKMSPQLRQQFESLVEDLYQQMVADVAADRKLDPEQVRKLVDQGLFTATAAKEAGLIDRVAYEDELKTAIREEHEADKLSVIKNYGKKKMDTEFSGFTGMVKLMNLMMGIEPTRSRGRGDKIALVYAVGAIMSGESQQGLFAESTLGADTIVKALRKAAADEKVKAIVLRVDSPGGSAIASDLIWREVKKIDKPVIASMGDVAASGGYYIAMGADQVFAEPATLTGSIGVVGGKLAMGDTLGMIGIHTETISRGRNSGVFSLKKPFSTAEREVITRLMEETYKQFTTKAAQGRQMELAKMQELAQGKVYTGRQAKELGLVDQLGTLSDAVAAAKKAAGIEGDKKVDLLILPKPKSMFEQLFGGPTVESRSISRQLRRLAPQFSAPLASAEMWQRLFAEPVNLVLPYQVQIR
ncbi:MAG: signal peptide peptidase SppA [Planctomycetales bacterium]|nr:signal peptide peptidase SppA [Planctomycetales bacterium]NIM08134.1 signal peptide peptidase SppA [Planctomycetales bacterium]NIN07627.1 signal peptide peptidase SppA [Planctomycetales bacterium]NIN76744.1 signal peptide peptidase SppA [Planctomycetales bacterium]NIO33943.1 signal peptide peptidase SppA [Planctomycetales bacterium]